MTINNKEQQEEEQQQSLYRALLLRLSGISMPALQPRMSREERRAHLLSTLQLALDITSDVDDSFFESPV
jgi:hypothetical protein